MIIKTSKEVDLALDTIHYCREMASIIRQAGLPFYKFFESNAGKAEKYLLKKETNNGR